MSLRGPNSALVATQQAPLISGQTTGPLGLVQLPRMWLKMLLFQRGLLPEDYNHHGEAGTDKRLVEAFGIDRDALVAYIAREVPGYPTYEGWVRANSANLNAATIATFNESVLGFTMPEPRKSEWCARFGLDGTTFTRGYQLNQLDDWDVTWQQLAAPDAPSTPVIPAISTTVVGPLGIMHLPRLWLKCLLAGYGRLPEGFRHGVGGFDEMLTTALGIDRDAFVAYVEGRKPGYRELESWVQGHATQLDPESIAALNAKIGAHKMPPERAAQARERLHVDDPTMELGIPLNDLDDWALLHDQLAAART